jgi:hypothetical protein
LIITKTKMLDKVIRKVQMRRASATYGNEAGRYHKLETSGVEQISDEDLLRYTGKTRAELHEWARDRPGIAGDQAAGDSRMRKQATGLRGYQSAKGYGGWGWA